jgi:hypothetical protein
MANPETPARPGVAHPHRSGPLEPDRLLNGRYRLRERLGDGGHAEVWAAQDLQADRLVALKFLHLRSCTPEEAMPVLEHEAGMAQRLDHPGVLRVDDPQRDGAQVFLPMEYAAGGDASRLRGAPWQRILPVLLEVARVLEHAHSRGVVHRDVKPGNVLFNAAGQVCISDFGTSARTGSCDAMAAGSPFSASPQQLRDEPAATADDVYGLGALAYELLTRYPPFYPHFDAQRVQSEEPPRPVPAVPAPVTLLDLVQAMLARDARARPDLADVMHGFEACLAEATEFPDDSISIAPVPVAARGTAPPSRWSAGWWLLGAVVAAGLAALLWMPRPQPGDSGTVISARIEPAVRSVADAVVETPTPVGAPAAAVSTAQQYDEAVRTGAAALGSRQPALARAAFQRAQALRADSPEAQQGLAAAARLDASLTALAAATRLEAQGELAAARDAYQVLLTHDAAFQPARTALARVTQRLHERQLEDLLVGAADALRQGSVVAAQAAYDQAAAMAPDDVRVREGRQRVAEVLTSERNTADLAAGVALENAERWDDAVLHYRQVIERDGSLRFAQDGLARGERRAQLDTELRDYLARPERLTAPAVERAAQAAAARAEASLAGSPRLQQQLQALRAALQAQQVQVRVAITSDNTTRVRVAPVGDLGSFMSRELQLAPGHYTVTGTREGFRDVRYEMTLRPGQQEAALSVQCTERI